MNRTSLCCAAGTSSVSLLFNSAPPTPSPRLDRQTLSHLPALVFLLSACRPSSVTSAGYTNRSLPGLFTVSRFCTESVRTDCLRGGGTHRTEDGAIGHSGWCLMQQDGALRPQQRPNRNISTDCDASLSAVSWYFSLCPCSRTASLAQNVRTQSLKLSVDQTLQVSLPNGSGWVLTPPHITTLCHN